MNERTFLQKFEQSAERDKLVDAVYEEMLDFCKQEGITTDEISPENLEELADGFVTRGFGIPASDSTVDARGDWYSED